MNVLIIIVKWKQYIFIASYAKIHFHFLFFISVWYLQTNFYELTFITSLEYYLAEMSTQNIPNVMDDFRGGYTPVYTHLLVSHGASNKFFFALARIWTTDNRHQNLSIRDSNHSAIQGLYYRHILLNKNLFKRI